MAISQETKRWLEGLKKEGNLSDEAYAAIEASVSNEKADGYVKGSVLRQDDYSRNMADVQKAKKDAEDAMVTLAAKEAAVTKFQGELGTWKAGAEVDYRKALADREAAERRVAAVTGRLKTTAASVGLSEEDVLRDLDMAPVNKVDDKAGPDMSAYVRKEDITAATTQAARLDAVIHDLSVEYQELFGKPLRNAAGLIDEALASGKTLRQFTEEKFDFGKKRQEVSDAAIQHRIDDAVAAERSRILSDPANLGKVTSGREDLHGSPIFDRKETLGLPTKETDNGGGGISAAVAAFQSGAYSQNTKR